MRTTVPTESSETNRITGRLRCRREVHTGTDNKEKQHEVVYWIELAQNVDCWHAHCHVVNVAIPSVLIKGKESD
jgi:hypothetical protein